MSRIDHFLRQNLNFSQITFHFFPFFLTFLLFSTAKKRRWSVCFQIIKTRKDNQCYVMTASPARDMSADYNAWGHSMVVNPWGEILSEAGED